MADSGHTRLLSFALRALPLGTQHPSKRAPCTTNCSLTHTVLHSGSVVKCICDMTPPVTSDVSQGTRPRQGSKSVLTNLTNLQVLNRVIFHSGEPCSLPRGNSGISEKMVSEGPLFHCPPMSSPPLPLRVQVSRGEAGRASGGVSLFSLLPASRTRKSFLPWGRGCLHSLGTPGLAL